MDGCCYGGCGSYSGRSFLTKEEKLEMLKEYKDVLDKETKGVTERMAKLKNE